MHNTIPVREYLNRAKGDVDRTKELMVHAAQLFVTRGTATKSADECAAGLRALLMIASNVHDVSKFGDIVAADPDKALTILDQCEAIAGQWCPKFRIFWLGGAFGTPASGLTDPKLVLKEIRERGLDTAALKAAAKQNADTETGSVFDKFVADLYKTVAEHLGVPEDVLRATERPVSKTAEFVTAFMESNDRDPVVSGQAFPGGGGIYTLASGERWQFTLEAARQLPEGYPKWDFPSATTEKFNFKAQVPPEGAEALEYVQLRVTEMASANQAQRLHEARRARMEKRMEARAAYLKALADLETARRNLRAVGVRPTLQLSADVGRVTSRGFLLELKERAR